MRSLVLALLSALLLAPSAARADTPKRTIHVVLAGVDIPTEVPADVADRAKAILADTLSKRPEFILKLDGAPDPAVDPDGYKAYLVKNNLKSYAVVAKIAQWSRTVDPIPGGQSLKIHVELSLVGTSIPDKILALGGAGSSTIIQQVGKTIRPADEKFTIESALQEAIGLAIDDSLAKLGKKK
jgi:hypothetical protein